MRRTYIDWLRGVAVLIMIEWHAVDAWTADSARSSQEFLWLAVIGGWAAPLFLFLAGVAIPLAVTAQVNRGRAVEDASRALRRRGWQIFLYAHLFRVQSYLLNPYAVWHSIFKPDILNILGLGMVGVAACLGWARSLRARIAALACAAVAVLVITPYSRLWLWPDMLHPRLEAYVRPNGTFGQFTLFPWLVFMCAGALVGLWIAQPRPADRERRFHAQLAAAGLAAIGAGWVGTQLPALVPTSGTTSWSFLITRIGIMTMALSAAWVWLSRPTARRWSPLVVFGQTSLFVYWVHVELAYGVLSATFKRSLSIPESLAAYVVFTVFMLGLATWWRRREGQPWIPERLMAQRGAA